jgi:hypothetical protein
VIGIVTTFIVGIGTTDKLPTTVYPIKVDNTSIRVSPRLAESALGITPTPLLLSSVGVRPRNHSLVGQNQNSRVIVSIDNIIQIANSFDVDNNYISWPTFQYRTILLVFRE